MLVTDIVTATFAHNAFVPFNRKCRQHFLATSAYRDEFDLCFGSWSSKVIELSRQGDLGRAPSQSEETYIGVMVYGQHPTYDPKTNSVVRVSANRLRTKLQQYYEQAGSDYEVKIELPKGTYVPAFQRIESLSKDPELLPEENLLSDKDSVEAVPNSDARFRNRQVSLIAIVLLMFALISIILWNFDHKKRLVRGFFEKSTTIQVLTMEVGSSFDPAISPDGKHLAYVWGGPDENNYDIYIRDLYGSTPKRMTQSPAQDLHPAWSPDQSVLAYLRSTPRGGEIRQLSLQGEDRKITDIAGYTESVAYL
jgi:hypothetical protein